MKQLFSILMIVAMTGMISVFYGCEGEQGPAGPAGADGQDGKDAAANCMDCHNETTDLKAKIVQYQTSKHYTGGAYVRGSSASCAPCHATEGFRQVVAGEEVTGHDAPTPVGCRTCHAIHSTYTTDDFAVITTDPVTLVGDFTDGEVFDKGKGNLCVNCHQSRTRNYGLIVDSDDETEINSSHYGPHYGTPGNVLYGVGLYEVSGSMAYPAPASGHYAMIADACVTCHMVGTAHTFEPNEDACESCHGGDFDWSTQHDEIEGLFNELADLLVAEGLLEEVKKLLQKGYSKELKSMQSIGYRHMVEYIQGSLSWEDAVSTLKRDTRRYAKRQYTWFNSERDIKWFHPLQQEEILKEISTFLRESKPKTCLT